MSDTIATRDALIAPSDGQVQPASDTRTEGQSDSQPSNGQVDKAQENIRKLQSSYDKQIAELKQQQAQSQQYIQQMTQAMRQAEKNAAPDDYSKLEIDLRHEREEKQALAYRLQQIENERQAANARNDAFQKIATRFGVDVEDIEKVKPGDYDEAVEAAILLREKRKQKQQLDNDDKRERNAPDLGGGAPRTITSKEESEWQELVRRKDSPGQARWLRLHGR